jgi:hypothetical protein
MTKEDWDEEERKWIVAALDFCKSATEKDVLIMFNRFQDVNNIADIVITNASTADVIKELATSLAHGTVKETNDE